MFGSSKSRVGLWGIWLVLVSGIIAIVVACSGNPKATPSPIAEQPTATTVPAPYPTQEFPTATMVPTQSPTQEFPTATMVPTSSPTQERPIKSSPLNAESQFRLGVRNWEMGVSEGQHEAGREEILNAINLDVSNSEYIEYLYAHILPPPTYLQINGGVEIYTDKFAMPYFTASSDQVSQFSVTEVHTPANVAEGTAAIQLTWKKPSGTWASFIVGFDKDIANRQKALSGNLTSLGGLDRSHLGNFAIRFWAKGEGIKGGQRGDLSPDNYMLVKLQDQNLAFRDSIGNQMVSFVKLTETWKRYTISLSDMSGDRSIWSTFCGHLAGAGGDCELSLFKSPLSDFDWSRVKQINFDVPFYSTAGTIYLDDIRIIEM